MKIRIVYPHQIWPSRLVSSLYSHQTHIYIHNGTSLSLSLSLSLSRYTYIPHIIYTSLSLLTGSCHLSLYIYMSTSRVEDRTSKHTTHPSHGTHREKILLQEEDVLVESVERPPSRITFTLDFSSNFTDSWLVVRTRSLTRSFSRDFTCPRTTDLLCLSAVLHNF